MKTTALIAAALLAGAVPALAAEDPIAVRKALMESMGGAAGLTAGVLKGEIDYSPAIGKAAITATAGVAEAYADYFPEGSDTGGNTEASPKIWEDPAGFAEQISKLQAATAGAVSASGKSGPADAEAFKAAMQPVLATCKSCHETYRLDD